MLKTKKIISVTSLAAHKTASLKAQLCILGSAVLPVPTVILNGVGSYPNVHRQYTDIKPLLEGTINLAVAQNQEIYLFIGYLGQVQNVDIVTAIIQKYRNQVTAIIVDPIAGDNGKPYVDAEIIRQWPQLLLLSDIAIPNMTELMFFSDLHMSDAIENHIEAFTSRFPQLDYLITSYEEKEDCKGVYLKFGETKEMIRHTQYNVKLDGTGDVFASYFLRNYLLQGLQATAACKQAIGQTLNHIRESMTNKTSEIAL